MTGLRHDAHYLDRDSLSAKVKRVLDKPDNKRLYAMCGHESLVVVDTAAKFMLQSIGKALIRAGGKWTEVSVSWPIPPGCFQRLSDRLKFWWEIGRGPVKEGLRIAAVPIDEGLFALTLSLVRGER